MSRRSSITKSSSIQGPLISDQFSHVDCVQISVPCSSTAEVEASIKHAYLDGSPAGLWAVFGFGPAADPGRGEEVVGKEAGQVGREQNGRPRTKVKAKENGTVGCDPEAEEGDDQKENVATSDARKGRGVGFVGNVGKAEAEHEKAGSMGEEDAGERKNFAFAFFRVLISLCC